MGGPRIRVVVIDDDEATSEGLALLLETAGAEVQVAESATAGLAVIAAFEPAVVFLDLTLPDLPGIELAALIRTRTSRPPYLVALTGASGARERALAAGIDEFLVKPPGIDTLANIVERVSQRAR